MYLSSRLTSTQNVPCYWGHIDTTTICTRNDGTFSSPWIIYSNDTRTFIYRDGSYHYGGFVFTIHNSNFLWEGQAFPLPKRSSLSTIERLTLSLGLPINGADVNMEVDLETVTFRRVMECVVLLALKDLSLVPSSFTYAKQELYGQHILSVYLSSVNGSGRIPSDNPHIRWLNEQDTLQLKSKLFTTSGYQAGSHSMEYKPTELAEKIFSNVFMLLKAVDFKHTDITLKPLDFIVDINQLSDIRLRDVMLLLGSCIGYQAGFIIHPELIDTQFSRVYSIFTSISSHTRKLLGFINYDISSALQTICLQLVKDPNIYPLHQLLVNDKYTFRDKVAKEMGEDIVWVKKELSSADNRNSMPTKYKKSPTLQAYFEEALVLRKEIIRNAEPKLLERATDFARTKYKKTWVDGQKKPIFEPDGKKESSIFFFIWTQWERLIREAMMSAFDNPAACHQVHDAVYSKQRIDTMILEKSVLVQTGFNVKICVD